MSTTMIDMTTPKRRCISEVKPLLVARPGALGRPGAIKVRIIALDAATSNRPFVGHDIHKTMLFVGIREGQAEDDLLLLGNVMKQFGVRYLRAPARRAPANKMA